MRAGTSWQVRARRVATLVLVVAGLLALAPSAQASERVAETCRQLVAPGFVRDATAQRPTVTLLCAVDARVRIAVPGTGPASELAVRAGRPTVLRGTALAPAPDTAYAVRVQVRRLRGRVVTELRSAPVVLLPVRSRIAELALAEVGRRDRTRYGAPAGTPWCAYFASWVVRQTTQGVPVLPSVASWRAWGRAHGTWHQRPAVGDVVVYGTRHVGLVVAVKGDGTIDTVEGNFSRKVSHRRGVSLAHARRSYAPADIAGFVSPY